MKWGKWLESWDMTSLKIKASFLEMEWKPQDEDKSAAWELYVELLTRIATQPLDEKHGDEKTALDSVYSLFAITRQVLKNNTRNCTEFTKIAIVVLNQVIRPFTAKWHRLGLQGAFADVEKQKRISRRAYPTPSGTQEVHEDARRHGWSRRPYHSRR